MKKKILITLAVFIILFGGVFMYSHLIAKRSLLSLSSEIVMRVTKTKLSSADENIEAFSKRMKNSKKLSDKPMALPKLKIDVSEKNVEGMQVFYLNVDCKIKLDN